LGELIALPRPWLDLRGPASRGREGKGRKKGRKRREKGGKGKGKE